MSESFLVKVLGSLVRTRSVNPGISEAAMANRVAEWLRGTPAEITFVESLPERPSVAAVLTGSGKGPRLILNGHMDTVAIDDPALWTIEPFSGEVKNGYLYGRGACDMKAGLAVQIAVAHLLGRYIDRLKGSLILHFAMGEERGEPGTLSLLRAGFGGDFGITTEPTELKVATATRGAAYYRLHIRGRSIHASQPHLGINPILRLPAVLAAIEDYEEHIGKRRHPLLPSGTCTPTIVRAGVKENAVPDYCEVMLDRRLLPGETANSEMEALKARLDVIRASDPQFDFEISVEIAAEPAQVDPDSHFVRRLLDATEEVTGVRADVYGAPFGSDVRDLVNDAGVEAVNFGPGSVAECHCPDERVSVQQLRDAALVTAKLATDLLL